MILKNSKVALKRKSKEEIWIDLMIMNRVASDRKIFYTAFSTITLFFRNNFQPSDASGHYIQRVLGFLSIV